MLLVVAAGEADSDLLAVADRLAGVGEFDALLVGDGLLGPLVRAGVDKDRTVRSSCSWPSVGSVLVAVMASS